MNGSRAVESLKDQVLGYAQKLRDREFGLDTCVHLEGSDQLRMAIRVTFACL